MKASIATLILSIVVSVHGWTTLPNTSARTRLPARIQRSTPSETRLSAASPLFDSSIILAEESWRQYVPLVVSALVIVDILLGSPVLNLIVAPMKRQAEGDENVDGGSSMLFGSNTQQSSVNPKERIDSKQVAQDAIDRARNSMELRQYLDSRKDPIEEARKRLDKQTADVDQVLEQRRQNDS